MTDTPLIDAAICAGCAALDKTMGINDNCRHPGCDCRHKKTIVLAALRAALPLDPKWPRSSAVTRLTDLMRELYPEQFGDASPLERKITVTSTGYDPAAGRAVRDPTLE